MTWRRIMPPHRPAERAFLFVSPEADTHDEHLDSSPVTAAMNPPDESSAPRDGPPSEGLRRSGETGSTEAAEAALRSIVEHLRSSESLLCITGAGISADSGLPTYRGVGGLYDRGPTADGMPVEVALSGPVMATRPEVTWRYLHELERPCRRARFNRAHEVLALLEQELPRMWVLTQNVDGFHRAAGSHNVIEIHGNLHELRCTGRACPYSETVRDFAGLADLPRCPRCGRTIRPNVVLFEEALPPEPLAILDRELSRDFDLVLSVGTSSLFPYIAAPVIQAAMRGKPTVEINPGRTELSRLVTVRLAERAAPALDRIWTRYRGGAGSGEPRRSAGD
jgi:NAD-dependent deacetylase